MKYLISVYKRQGEESTSLLLRQYQCRRVPVCFACLCTCGEEKNGEAARYITGQLLQWCRSLPWHRFVRRPAALAEGIASEAEERIRGAAAELKRRTERFADEGVRWCVLVCIGNRIVLNGQGQHAYLLSMTLGKGVASRLGSHVRGTLESGAGILLTEAEPEKGFAREGNVPEAIRVSAIGTEEQAEKYLGEYMRNTDTKAAVLIIAGEESGGR